MDVELDDEVKFGMKRKGAKASEFSPCLKIPASIKNCLAQEISGIFRSKLAFHFFGTNINIFMSTSHRPNMFPLFCCLLIIEIVPLWDSFIYLSGTIVSVSSFIYKHSPDEDICILWLCKVCFLIYSFNIRPAMVKVQGI
jgi:hypothetical protein